MRSFHTTLPTSGSCENDIAEVSVPGVETQPVGTASRRAVSVTTSGAAGPPRLRTSWTVSLIHHLCDRKRVRTDRSVFHDSADRRANYRGKVVSPATGNTRRRNPDLRLGLRRLLSVRAAVPNRALGTCS